MKIFVSWSGKASKLAAELLKDWLPHVVQRAELYVSSQDIEKGERWAASIAAKLSEIDFGIIVVTPSNIDAPWVNFEAGALSKSVRSRVIPLLCGMDRIDAASSPLRQFQYALATKDEIQRLVFAVNDACDQPLDAGRLESAFEKWWPEFEKVYDAIEFEAPKKNETKDGVEAKLGKIESALEAIMGDLAHMQRNTSSRAFRSDAADSAEHQPPLWAKDMIASQARDRMKSWAALTKADRNAEFATRVRYRNRPQSKENPPESDTEGS